MDKSCGASWVVTDVILKAKHSLQKTLKIQKRNKSMFTIPLSLPHMEDWGDVSVLAFLHVYVEGLDRR